MYLSIRVGYAYRDYDLEQRDEFLNQSSTISTIDY
jgi:hypothetical protein